MYELVGQRMGPVHPYGHQEESADHEYDEANCEHAEMGVVIEFVVAVFSTLFDESACNEGRDRAGYEDSEG